ncbi:MAG: hypothetical protein U5K84_10815 [Alkalibacterium sp.]|nr:hypothetical protein [Alkalibacterium sp.]
MENLRLEENENVDISSLVMHVWNRPLRARTEALQPRLKASRRKRTTTFQSWKRLTAWRSSRL